MHHPIDRLIFTPDDVDLSRSPLRGHFDTETYVLGAFNPGMTRLPNGNLLLMVRIAEALRTPIKDQQIHAIRWHDGGFCLDAWPIDTGPDRGAFDAAPDRELPDPFSVWQRRA